MGVRERHFKTRLRQRGNLIPNENITGALQDGLRRAVNQVLATTPNLHDQDRLYFTIGSDRLHNNFQGWGLRAGEWREGGERMDALFDRLAQALNSNEQIEMDDSFQLSITQVHHAPQGTGRPRRGKPGHPTMELLTKTSKSVIRIQNKDELCCARALVVAKAKVDQHPKEKAIRQGKSLQRTLALELQHEANVPLGPCSYDALTKFSAAPSLAHYQIILVDAHRSFHITTFGPLRDKQLILLHDHGHYDVITRLPGFFGSSYMCAHCWKPYNTEGKHRCTKKKQCGACRQKECPDFLEAYPRGLKATQRCHSCHRDFFGDTQTRHQSSNHRLLSSPSMPLLPKAGRRGRTNSTASMWLPGLSFLSRVRGRRHSPMFHSKSPKASRREKEEKEETSRRSSHQTRGRRGASNPQRTGGGARRRGRRQHTTPARVF